MSRKGGYKIIDLKGYDLTKDDYVIDGIYEDIESNYGKPILFSGIVIDGIEKDDVFTKVEIVGSSYSFSLYGKTITISDVDVVSSKIYLTKLTNDYVSKPIPNGYYEFTIPQININGGTRAINVPFIGSGDSFVGISFDPYIENNQYKGTIYNINNEQGFKILVIVTDNLISLNYGG